ncbi:molecular chaperone HscC [Undibacterium cyanobacteriorum]|uniref:Molecular chaperone HscC n=1 Tax=Undibacterium cyanobacteriorum TaxID=3073561 RepID=A0ABY9RML4_9BURK|nr:molecular chaperone HscC [Undibacterium sp. 20NA77.5]WMW82123.1 molecular chaperone HscC [Undibacterium sp. 20NA77.5]
MIIGIDLGTTNSLVAIWRDGKAQLIPNSLGEFLTPSCVSLDEDGTVLVGKAARERLQTHPERTAAVFKRYMGSDKKIRLGDKEFRAEELSSFVLKSLKQDAEAFLGEPVTEAVITVPAYFSDAQRKATKVAGQLANLKVDRLVNEPTAAALAYGMHQFKDECKFLVFDLGGGTFDVSILEMFDGVMEVRASAGDNFLGGEDITKVMVDAFIEKHEFPAKVRNDARFMQQLFAAAEKAKRELSSGEKALMEVQTTESTLQLEFNEELFTKITSPLVKRLREPVERALRDTNLRSNQLDSIVLAGGATRMPIIKRLVTLMFGRFPLSDINPDEVVAMGAAVQAGLKMKDSALDEVVMTDVAPYSLGVDTAIVLSDNKTVGGQFSPIIERNSTVPVSRVKRYYPIEDKQDKLIFNIYQGESRLVKDNIFLGKMEFPLDPLPSQDNGVDLRFTYDVNGLLEVQATVLRNQQKHAMVIQGNPGLLSDEQIATRLADLEKIKMHPRDTLEIRTVMARADRVYQQLKGDTRAWLTTQIAEFEQVVETQNPKLIAPAQKRFVEVLDEIERDVVLHPDFTE